MENKEAKEIKNKYKKLRNSILCVILVIVIVLLVKFIYNYNIVKKIFENNVNVNLGNNYKITKVTNDTYRQEIYYKDGDIKALYNDNNCMLWIDDTAYICVYDKEEYTVVRNNETGESSLPMKPYGGGENVSIMGSIAFYEEDVDSFLDIAKIMIFTNMNVKEEVIDNEELYVLETGVDVKMWFNKENYSLRRELHYGDVSEYKIEKGVVTDKDIKLPQDQGFTEIKVDNN